MIDGLTRVHLHFGRDYFNYYIRFGTPVFRDEYAAREAYEYYASGAIFGYIRWETNQYGTKNWRFFVLRGGNPSTVIYIVPGISPGAEVLADISGSERVYRLFKALDLIEEDNIDLSDVAPWYWIQTNARVNSMLDPLSYSIAQHSAWLLEKAVS